MNWIALVVAAGLAAAAARHHHAPRHHSVPVAQRQASRPPAHKGVLRARAGAPVSVPQPGGTPVAPLNRGPTATPTAAPTATATPAPLPTATGVDLNDTDGYTLYASHNVLRAGTVTFNAVNFGMDDHNLTIDDASGDNVGYVALPADQDTYSISADLAPGTYRLYCSLLNHAALGMQATITVRSG